MLTQRPATAEPRGETVQGRGGGALLHPSVVHASSTGQRRAEAARQEGRSAVPRLCLRRFGGRDETGLKTFPFEVPERSVCNLGEAPDSQIRRARALFCSFSFFNQLFLVQTLWRQHLYESHPCTRSSRNADADADLCLLSSCRSSGTTDRTCRPGCASPWPSLTSSFRERPCSLS